MCPVNGGGIVEFECIGKNADLNITSNHSYFFTYLPNYPKDATTLQGLKQNVVNLKNLT